MRHALKLLTYKKGALLFLLLFFSLLCLKAYNAKQNSSPFSYSAKMPIKHVKTNLIKRMEAVGGKQTYSEFKSAVRPATLDTQHLLAHVFGEALYNYAGKEGITICDGAFSFGCYHSFFGKAFQQYGKESITALNELCIQSEAGVGCQHGIGHGLLEFYGENRLLDALLSCEEISGISLYGCSAGVFMEYNVPMVINDDMAYTRPRKLDQLSPYGLCPTLSEIYQTSCYHELPQWWNAALQGNFDSITKWCTVIAKSENRTACVTGIGNIAPPSTQFDSMKTVSICQKLEDTTDQNTCLLSAAATYQNNSDRETIRRYIKD